ncbi:LAMI_0H04874g1_1 [Lachancea mirantina]|uniref:LAMI_0H04874g1_1 n=1 Tax=Lachancea mirantina TaxID=1230905 RepID=A0A1G4KEY1_9SACH|nr:LAMI_0H04874g1_1 [Lachancea mirantina]
MQDKLIICMVGLPARGKSYIAERLVRYYQNVYGDAQASRLFNAGKERRTLDVQSDDERPELRRTVTLQPCRMSDDLEPEGEAELSGSAADAGEPGNQGLFDTQDRGAVLVRDGIAMRTLAKLCEWLNGGTERHVGVFDATNTTRARRALIKSAVGVLCASAASVVFLESVCRDERVVHRNIVHKVHCSPDYMHRSDKAWCYRDFERRVTNYERVYEPCDVTTEVGDGVGCVRVSDLGAELEVCGDVPPVHATRLVNFLQSLYPRKRSDETGAADGAEVASPHRVRSGFSVIDKSSCSSSSSSLFSNPGLLLVAQPLDQIDHVLRLGHEHVETKACHDHSGLDLSALRRHARMTKDEDATQ